jgi:DNA-binding NtrC family response regulator
MTGGTGGDVLVVEDDPAFASALAVAVRRAGGTPRIVHSCARAQAALGLWPIRIVVLDLGLPDAPGFELLRRVALAGADCPPVIVITAHGALGNEIEARRLGVVEFFDKPLHLPTFQGTLAALLEDPPGIPEVPDISRDDPGTGSVPERSWLAAVCAERFPVLLEGETGAGKTRLAGWLARRGGHAKVVEEIGGLPLAEQERLAERCEGEGAAWVLATTSVSLASRVRSGEFSRRLWFRLQRGWLRLPPLRERRDELAERGAAILRELRPGITFRMAPGALAALAAHDWPGNFRELENVLEGCCRRLGARRTIEAADVPRLGAEEEARAVVEPADAARRWLDERLREHPEADYETLLGAWERGLLLELLQRHGGKPSRLAAARNLNRATLRRRLRELGWRKEG